MERPQTSLTREVRTAEDIRKEVADLEAQIVSGQTTMQAEEDREDAEDERDGKPVIKPEDLWPASLREVASLNLN